MVACFFIQACVPNRKIQYLQHNDVNKNNIQVDTLLRTYDLKVEEYRIQPLDILDIRIESLTEKDFDFIERLYPIQQRGIMQGQNILINGFLVDNNGEIEFPVMGKLRFSGLTVFEAEHMLQRALVPYLNNPVVRIRLLNFRFTVIGEVNQENQIVTMNTRVTLAEAIALAGGLTDLADRSAIKVIRQKGNQAEVFYMNLLDESVINSDRFYVQQNDLIIVPPLRQRPIRRYWSENLALFVSTLTVILLLINLTK